MTVLMHSHTWDVLHTERMTTGNRTILILLLPSVMFTICVFIGVCACVCVQHPHSLQATQQGDNVNWTELLPGSLAGFCAFHMVQLVFAAWIAESLLGSLTCLRVTQ